MALTETTRWFFGVDDDYQIRVRRTRVILDGTEIVGEQHHSEVVEPGQDLSSYPQRVQAVCGRVWTPQIIAAYQAAKAARPGFPP